MARVIWEPRALTGARPLPASSCQYLCVGVLGLESPLFCCPAFLGHAVCASTTRSNNRILIHCRIMRLHSFVCRKEPHRLDSARERLCPIILNSTPKTFIFLPYPRQTLPLQHLRRERL